MKCLLAVFTGLCVFAQSAHLHAASEEDDYSKEKCIALEDIKETLYAYIDTYVKTHSELPVMPEEESHMRTLLIENYNLTQCIVDHTLDNHFNYIEALGDILETLHKNTYKDQETQALYALLIELNHGWESTMLSRRLIDKREANTNQILRGMGLLGAALAGRIGFKNITKIGRYIGNLSGKASGAHIVKALTGLGSNPAALRVATISTLGVGESGVEYFEYDQSMDSNLEVAEGEARVHVSKTGDFENGTWPSPYNVIDITADHKSNELSNYETYELFRDLSSLTVGTLGGIYIQGTATQILEARFPIATKYKQFMQSSSKVPAFLSAGRPLAIGATSANIAVGLVIGLGSYKLIDIGTGQIADLHWDITSNDKLEQTERRLSIANTRVWDDFQRNKNVYKDRRDIGKYTRHREAQKYWESELNNQLETWEDGYQPQFSSSPVTQNHRAKVSENLIDLANKYIYQIHQKAEYIRGPIDAKYQLLILDFVDEYLSIGMTYQKYAKDNADRKKGVKFTDGRIQLKDQRAQELERIGFQKIEALEKEFKQEIKEFVRKYKGHPDLFKSYKVYDQAAKFLQFVEESSGRYFLNKHQRHIRAAKARDVYRLTEDLIWNRAKLAASLSLAEVLNDPDERHGYAGIIGQVKSTYETTKYRSKIIKSNISAYMHHKLRNLKQDWKNYYESQFTN